jgi:hypothetical protein
LFKIILPKGRGWGEGCTNILYKKMICSWETLIKAEDKAYRRGERKHAKVKGKARSLKLSDLR